MAKSGKRALKPANDDLRNISPTSPLRLEVAARLAFPDGSMTIRGLRRQIARGRLAYEVIAGKHYTTLADIDEMRKRCRIQAKVREPSVSRVTVRGVTVAGLSPRELLRARLERSLKRKPKSSSPKPDANK